MMRGEPAALGLASESEVKEVFRAKEGLSG
jgi:hypothetical protein